MINIIGTAHISSASVEEVKQKVFELQPSAIAVELDETRLKGMLGQREIPVVELIRDKNSFLVVFNVLLSFLQRRMGAEVGVAPGKEMLTAIEAGKELGVPTALVDRDIDITLGRLMAEMGLIEKLRLLKEIILSFAIGGEELKREVERAKQEEKLHSIMEELERLSPAMHSVVVKERDAYMAHKLIELEDKYGNIVAIVGAGHRRGIEHYINRREKLPPLKELVRKPKKRFSLTRALKYIAPLAVISIFILAFTSGVSIEGSIYLWLLNHMVPTFIGVAIAGGSVYSALVGMLTSPITSLNPMLAAGWFAGYTEARVKKVTVSEVSEMFEQASFRELYGNRAFKVILVTALANLGSILGTFVSFPTIILPLYRSIAG